MQTSAADPKSVLVTRIQEQLQRLERRRARLRSLNTRVVTLNLVLSAIATALAGVTAVTGPLVGEGPPAWRWTCGLVAVVTAAAALTTGIQQRFHVPERLARTLACVGKLRSLELALQLSRSTPEDAAGEYEELLESYPEELA